MEELLSQIASNPKLFNSEKVRGFFSSSRHHENKEIRVNTEIIKTCTPMKATVSINNPEMIPYIESFGYSELIGLADGASKAVFKAKNQRK